MKTLIFALVLLFLPSCLIQSERNDVKVKFDHKHETPTSYKDCVDTIGGVTKGSFIARGKYKRCVIIIGISHSAENPSELRAGAAGTNPHSYAELSSVKKLMDLHGITCEKGDQQEGQDALLRFKFPLNDIGHKDYEYIDVKCPIDKKDDLVFVELGFDKENKSLTFDMKFGDMKSSATFHLLDTDNNGVIKRHVKVRGVGGKKEVILDNYKLQAAE